MKHLNTFESYKGPSIPQEELDRFLDELISQFVLSPKDKTPMSFLYFHLDQQFLIHLDGVFHTIIQRIAN